MQTPDTVTGEMTTIEALQRLRGIRVDPAILDRQETDPIYGAIAVSRASGGQWTPGDCLWQGRLPQGAVDCTPIGNGRELRDPEAAQRWWDEQIAAAKEHARKHRADTELRMVRGSGVRFSSDDVAVIKSIVSEVFDE